MNEGNVMKRQFAVPTLTNESIPASGTTANSSPVLKTIVHTNDNTLPQLLITLADLNQTTLLYRQLLATIRFTQAEHASELNVQIEMVKNYGKIILSGDTANALYVLPIAGFLDAATYEQAAKACGLPIQNDFTDHSAALAKKESPTAPLTDFFKPKNTPPCSTSATPPNKPGGKNTPIPSK